MPASSQKVKTIDSDIGDLLYKIRTISNYDAHYHHMSEHRMADKWILTLRHYCDGSPHRGEKIVISLTQLTGGAVRVQMHSQCRLSCQVVDYGANSKNIAELFLYLECR